MAFAPYFVFLSYFQHKLRSHVYGFPCQERSVLWKSLEAVVKMNSIQDRQLQNFKNEEETKSLF